MRKFNAFTLAEVLITLGIIGVVAAMTMPTLINQTNGAQYKAAYKKALSAISQAVTLNVALDDISFADTASDKTTLEQLITKRMNVVKSATTAGYTFQDTSASAKYKITCGENNLAGKTDAVDNCTKAGDIVDRTGTITFANLNKFLFFNDGSMFAYTVANSTGCTASNNCIGIIDVNGAKGPNKVVSNPESPTDIYPVVFYDQTILPASEEASQVLYAK